MDSPDPARQLCAFASVVVIDLVLAVAGAARDQMTMAIFGLGR